MNKKSVISWCFYDWANTAFSTVIITFIFSVYFTKEIAADEITGSSQWSMMIGLSGLVIALLSPFLGAIADQGGRRKRWIVWLSLLCIIPTGLLWFAAPDHPVLPVLIVVGVANIGLELAQVFVNAMLPFIAPKEKMGRVSGWAWGLGYMGGLLALVLILFGFVGLGEAAPWVVLPQEDFFHIRIAGPLVAIWFLLFMIPLLLFTKEKEQAYQGFSKSIRNGLKQLKDTIKNATYHKNFGLYLLSSAIYRDGLVTLFAIGGVYAAGQFGMGFTDILIFAIGLNVTAGLGAFALAFADDRYGSKRTILMSLSGLILIGAMILMVTDKVHFMILSLGLGIFMGPVQAASRTMVARLCPKDMITQGYGLYALTGKSAAFLGPLAFAAATSLFGSQQAGMVSIILFWLVGALLLWNVKESPS